MFRWSANRSLLAGTLAAFGASLCCLGPLVLLLLGIGGGWMSRLTSLEPLRPFFMAAALLCIGLAFRRIYLAPPACEPGSGCRLGPISRQQRLLFWGATLVVFALLSGPWLVPLLF